MVRWISGKANPADAMTKIGACDALKKLVETNTVDLTATENGLREDSAR